MSTTPFAEHLLQLRADATHAGVRHEVAATALVADAIRGLTAAVRDLSIPDAEIVDDHRPEPGGRPAWLHPDPPAVDPAIVHADPAGIHRSVCDAHRNVAEPLFLAGAPGTDGGMVTCRDCIRTLVAAFPLAQRNDGTRGPAGPHTPDPRWRGLTSDERYAADAHRPPEAVRLAAQHLDEVLTGGLLHGLAATDTTAVRTVIRYVAEQA